MSNQDLEKLLIDSNVMSKGHFLLTSGRHSDVYFEKFRILEQPRVLSILCGQIAEHFSGFGIEYVMGPTTGGIIIAFEVARQMELPALYVESEDGHKTLRRNASLPSGAKVLVVDDVFTTGRSVVEVCEVVREREGIVSGVGVLIDRSESKPDFGCEVFSSYRVESQSYAPDAIPDWLAAIPITKPGTRTF
jgi:orotate phosphoribosyltransferase